MTGLAYLPWMRHAETRCGIAPDEWFRDDGGSVDDRKATQRARSVCRDCPARVDCALYALTNREPYGVWGAVTGDERRALLRRRSA